MPDLVSVYDKHESAQVRAQRQQRWVAKHKLPLITLTTYMPEHMARRPLADKVFAVACQALGAKLVLIGCDIIKEEVFHQKSGNEAMLIVQGLSSSELKRAMIKLEREHSLGALFNLDVMDSEGKTISRKASEMEARKCLICNRPASYCSTVKKHSAVELEARISVLTDSYFEQGKEAVA